MNEETATTEYRAEDLLCLARRYHNAKRSYLLVNRRQAKHLPSQPKEALLLMRALGEKIRAAFPDAHLIVAFAETATAVGLMATEGVGGHCLCLTTTREAVAGVADWIEFREEHSHATEQRLDGASLRRMLAETQTVVFLILAGQLVLLDDVVKIILGGDRTNQPVLFPSVHRLAINVKAILLVESNDAVRYELFQIFLGVGINLRVISVNRIRKLEFRAGNA